MSGSRNCYVIMPFHESYATVYTDAIRPALLRVASERGEQWKCQRSDEIRVPGSIHKEMVTSLQTADLVIADLSGNNPNVFYELGVAHSAGRPTIMITQQIDKLPFDINTYRAHGYTATPAGLGKLSDYLATTIVDIATGSNNLTNPVLDFAPIHHARVILHLADVQRIEGSVKQEVCVLEPSLDTDLTLFGDIVKRNLRDRQIRYRYLLPRVPGLSRQFRRFTQNLGCDPLGSAVQVRSVEQHIVESEVVIFDPFTDKEDVMIMSPRHQDFVFWYRVGKSRGEAMRDRFEFLWENCSQPVTVESA